MSSNRGVDLIAAERQRQIEHEGWTPEHDDEHTLGELARAAACYALDDNFRDRHLWDRSLLHQLWPWERVWWKPVIGDPTGRVRELVKAGALIAAEIDRLQRTEEYQRQRARLDALGVSTVREAIEQKLDARGI